MSYSLIFSIDLIVFRGGNPDGFPPNTTFPSEGGTKIRGLSLACYLNFYLSVAAVKTA